MPVVFSLECLPNAMMNLKNEVCKSFNQQASLYEQAAKVQNEVGKRLFERLYYLKIEPRYVLDLGCGTGVHTKLLRKYYPKAITFGLDFAYKMLLQAKKKQTWRCKWPLVNADMMQLPFANGIFDLVFANQVVHWSQPLSFVMRELNRVMRQDGCLMFSTLGPDTFKELKQAWCGIDNYAHTNDFLDMHDIGDCLITECFSSPVVDMELLTLHYNSLKQLLLSLKSQGVRNINPARKQGLTGRESFRNFESAYENFSVTDNKYPLTYEVIYGHAWKSSQRRVETSIETSIPIKGLKRSRSVA